MIVPQVSYFEKIGPTAFVASLCRQFTALSYAKEFAQLVETQGLVEPSLSQHVGKAFAGIVHLEARYKAISQVIAKYQITQFLELASGLLPRGMAMSSNPNITFIESDLPAVIRCKQKLVQQLIGARPNLHFLEIDATSCPSQFVQSASYFKAAQPVLILCEGLLMHLTRSEQQRVCANVRQMLSLYGGVWITSDFTFEAGLKQSLRLLQNNPVFLQQIQAMLDFIGKSPDDDFQTLDQARQFAYEQGFRVAEHSILNVIDQLSCLEILGLDTEEVKKVLADQSVFALTLDAT